VAAVGLTLVDPLADTEVKVPGAMDTLVAPVVDQLSALLAPEAMLAGPAEKELITGLLAAATLTVTFAVAVPAALVAVNV